MSKLEAVGRLVDARATAPEAARILRSGTSTEQADPLALSVSCAGRLTFQAVVSNAVLAGGDTDAIAAMSAALSGALTGEESIPPRWVARLHAEAKGPAHVRSLADSIAARCSEAHTATDDATRSAP
jgi:ADP-ribosylglycohydrolase